MAQAAIKTLPQEDSGIDTIGSQKAGTFLAQGGEKLHQRKGGYILSGIVSNDSYHSPKITDIKRPGEPGARVLETPDPKKLARFVIDEAVKILNLDPDRITEKDVRKFRRVLYVLDPVKYRSLSPANDGNFALDEFGELPKNTLSPQIESKAKKLPVSKVEINNKALETKKHPEEPKIFRPRQKTLRLVRNDVSTLGEAPEKQPKPALEHPLIAKVRPSVSLQVTPEPKPQSKPVIIKKQEDLPIEGIVENKKERGTEKMSSVNTLFATLFGTTKEATELAGPLRNSVPRESAPIEEVLLSGLPVSETKSWRDSLQEKEVAEFVHDLMHSDENSFLINYLGLDTSASNASFLSDASNVDTYDVLYNPDETKYHKREELSSLIEKMKEVASLSGTKITEAKGLSLHMMRDQARASVASADKREKK